MAVLVLSYLAAGVLVCLWFFFGGHARIDSSSADAVWYTRLLWLPGVMMLWPLMMARLITTDGS